jgi:hypothetical protein
MFSPETIHLLQYSTKSNNYQLYKKYAQTINDNGILEEDLAWLREAGFQDVDCFWKFTTTVVYGGFKF